MIGSFLWNKKRGQRENLGCIMPKISYVPVFINLSILINRIWDYIENPAYVSYFITTSQIKKVTNKITGFLFL
jgi:hypothetical protein